MTKPVRVLIVDDSATIRGLLKAILARDPGIEVVGAACDAATARTMIKELLPDVITLDVEMPDMNGLEFLEKIMRLRPMPVVMISTLTQRGAEVTLAALEMGAVDYFPKPTEDVAATLAKAAEELAAKVKGAAGAKVRGLRSNMVTTPRIPAGYAPNDDVIAIGSSTGGVEALIEVLTHFPENCPPTVITQHMPAHFTASFAQRLDRLCLPSVCEATDGAPLRVGQIYLAPGSDAHLSVHRGSSLTCRLKREDAISGHRPSVDVLFSSVAAACGENAVGVILTGMGRDGANGLLAMRKTGAFTVGQDEATCTVYGMPRAAFELGAVAKQFSLEAIGPAILKHTQRAYERSA
ncbi:MAG TPA: chemotaxis response regulator protein-glutamate methylesterase [Rhizomicrobium sp.]|nr:chemotaxis response regulator protein-glutamate methylesterase [Rhizomicrobium sp.]